MKQIIFAALVFIGLVGVAQAQVGDTNIYSSVPDGYEYRPAYTYDPPVLGYEPVDTSNMGFWGKVKESWRPKIPYDTWDTLSYGFMVGSQVADVHSTHKALHGAGSTCHEKNLIYGEDPSDTRLIVTKVVATGLFTWVSNNIPNHAYRRWMNGVIGLVTTGAALHNYNMECY